MKEDKKHIFREIRFNPAQFLAISFIITIFVGTILLSMPFSTASGHISFTDALFTSTSAVCVTGLIVQDTGTYFSPVGQVIIMLLFQIGGLGIMTFSTLVLLVAGKSIAIKDSISLKEDFLHASTLRVHSLIKNILLYTLCLESLGTLFFYLNFNHKFSTGKAMFHSVFHSISAFCNAGFCLYKDSFESFKGDIWINMNLIALIILGGLGFVVLRETVSFFPNTLKKRKIRFSLHTRLVVKVTLFLIIFSSVLFFILEYNNSLENFSLKKKILVSVFQVVTPRTAGFNTMDLNTLGFGMVFFLIVLMFIGASPGSTGGGVKTTTVGAVVAFLKSRILARESVSLFNRTVPYKLITKAFTVITLGIGVISVSIFFLLISQPEVTMKEVFFEVFSAFGTVGLSLGLTPRLNDMGKIIIIMTMYIGRIGPLTFLYAFSREKAKGRYDYVEESIMIG
ncbi:MAG: TrkH family potassium uptake protein [Candidatus Aminicenantes bacterium]